MADITYLKTTKENEIFITLCSALNAEFARLLSGAVNPTATRADKTGDFTDVILAFAGSVPIACIALRPFDKDTAEIKRMYVIPEMRNSGIGTKLIEKITAVALGKGCKFLVLETNEKLPDAKRLYEKMGFAKIKSYGPYDDLEETLCMGKKLTKE